MNEKIVEMLHLSLEPVGIFLGNTSAICELEASPQKRNCVIPFVLAAAKGKITSLDEDGCITMIPTGSFRQRSTREEALAIISRIPAMT